MHTTPVLRVVEREALVWARMWRGVLFSMFVQPLLYLAALGVGVGGLVDESSGRVDGVDYLEFVAPGLLLASAMQLAASESMWPVLARVKWSRQYFGASATPIEPSELCAGFVAWAAVRAFLGGAAFVAVAALVGAVPSAWGVLAVPAAALCAAAFAAPLAAFSVLQQRDSAFPMVMRLGVLPLFLFSGTFFPVDRLPDALEPLVVCSPLWHGVELARAATTGHADAPAAGAHVAVLALVVGAGIVAGARTFTRRLYP
jgi:lipooligosaccharide transport system permease protein